MRYMLLGAALLLFTPLVHAQQPSTNHGWATAQRSFSYARIGQQPVTIWSGHESQMPTIFQTGMWEKIDWERYGYSYAAFEAEARRKQVTGQATLPLTRVCGGNPSPVQQPGLPTSGST